MDRSDVHTDPTAPDLSRRQVLGGIGTVAVGAGAAKAADNVLAGYGVLTGTNLRDQDLPTHVRDRFSPLPATTSIADVDVSLTADTVRVVPADGGRRRFSIADATAATETDEALGLEGTLAELVTDFRELRAGAGRFVFSRTPEFLDRIANAAARPWTVDGLRGDQFVPASPDIVRRFADVDPASTAALIDGLASGFREHGSYDVERYLAGSIEDNLLFGFGDLRAPFRSPTDFEALLAGDNTGLFCYDFTYRSIEAFHAIPAPAQTVPVFGAVVTDARHKHVYTGLASVVREDGDLVVPMTFVDYMHATLNAEFGLRWLLGEGIEAYDDRHRTTDVFWNEYARW